MNTVHPTATALTDPRPVIAPPPPRRPVQWRRALQALRALLDDPDDTAKAFEVFLALDGDEEEQRFQRLLADPSGARLAAQRPSLIDALSDRAALQALPAGSLGRAYLVYLDANGFAADGLVKLKADMEAYAASVGEALPVLDATREWFRVRGLLVHDLWHVLTGYGTDDLGETLLLGFSCAQVPGRANRLLLAGAALRSVGDTGAPLAVEIYRAWRRGRRAVWLAALPYESLLAEPLDAVRALARIEPAAVAHPNGIPRGSRRSAPPANAARVVPSSGGRA